jgi:hypothetical protein
LPGRRLHTQRCPRLRIWATRAAIDLTFCAPKSVSLVRVLRTDDGIAKAIADAKTAALSEAVEYLANHAGYTRITVTFLGG